MRELPWGKLVLLGALGALVSAGLFALRATGAPPDEVTPIVWNREACAHCRMLIGEPHSAAQLVTAESEVLSFDDPGCALRYLQERRPRLHRLWFHHGREERWLAGEEVAFLLGGVTPMGSGLRAVERGTAGALELEAAARHASAPALAPAAPEGSP